MVKARPIGALMEPFILLVSCNYDITVGSAVAFTEFQLVGSSSYVLRTDPATYHASGNGFGIVKSIKRDQIKQYLDDQGDLNLKCTVNVVTHVGMHQNADFAYELPYRAQTATYKFLQSNRENVTIECPDGRLTTQKALLQHQSPVFRRMFRT